MPKVKYMRVTADWFVELCKGGETRRARPIAHSLPSDARFVDAKITETGSLILIVESQSYPDLEVGGTITEQPATEFEVVRGKFDQAAALLAVQAIRLAVQDAEMAYGRITDPDEWDELEGLLKS